MRRASVIGVIAVLVAAADVAPAAAQAWLPPQNVLGVTFFTQAIDHYGRIRNDPDGDGPLTTIHECCGLTNVAAGAEIIYGVTSRVALSAGVPFVWSKYHGDEPPFGILYSPLDSCHCTQGALQDVTVAGHVNLFRKRRGTSITSTVSFGTPTNAYEYSGEATAGYGLKELGLSVAVDHSLDMWVRGLSVEGGYGYGFVEESLNIPHDRSKAHIGADYRFARQFSAHSELTWQHTHGGLTILDVKADAESEAPRFQTEFHRLMRDNFLHVGVGLVYPLNGWQLAGNYRQAVKGYPTHRVHVLSIAVTRSFSLKRRPPPTAPKSDTVALP